MKLIEQLRKKLEMMGATLEWEDGFRVVNCDAPSGYIWRANGCSCICIQCENHSQTWYAKAIKNEMPSLRMGLDKVTDPEDIAAMRYDQGDDTWGAPADAPDRIEWPS